MSGSSRVPRDADAGRAYELLAARGGRQPPGRRSPAWPTARSSSRPRSAPPMTPRRSPRPTGWSMKLLAPAIADQLLAPSPSSTSAPTPSWAAPAAGWSSGRRSPRMSLPSGGETRDRLVVPCGRELVEIARVARSRAAAMKRPGLPARRRPAPAQRQVPAARCRGRARAAPRLRSPAAQRCAARAAFDLPPPPQRLSSASLQYAATGPSPTSWRWALSNGATC